MNAETRKSEDSRSVTRCRRFPFDANEIMRLMVECETYGEWWPETYDIEVKQCVPGQPVGTHVRFQSWLGPYSSFVEKSTARQLHVRYGEGSISGWTRWRLRAVTEQETDVCFTCVFEPKSVQAKMAMAVSSDEYAASYLYPYLDSLRHELDRRRWKKANNLAKKLQKAKDEQSERAVDEADRKVHGGGQAPSQ